MAITDENATGMVMPVAPMGNGGGYGGMFDGNGWWILLLFILLGNGGFGWGNGMGFGAGFGNTGAAAMDMYPWFNQQNNMNSGFRDQMLNTQVDGIRNAITTGFGDTALGIAGINQNICQTGNGIMSAINAGAAGTAAAITGVQNALAQQMYGNQIADLERSFAAQTAQTAGMSALQAQLAQCCCDNRAATADLKYTVATENCADRTSAMQNTRDIIDASTRNTQAILDKLCALELDGVKSQLAQAQRDNIGLQNQLNMANLAASQAAQTATFQQGLNDEVDALYNRFKNCPVNTVPVYGNQPIFNNGNCGCGCGNM